MQTSIAPSTIRSRHPAAECSLCPAQIFAPLAKRASRIARRSFPHRHGSSSHTRSQSSTSRANRIACSSVHPWFASAASMNPSPPACRARRARAASCSGSSPPTLSLKPGQSELLQFSDLRRKIRVVRVVATDRDHRELRAITSPETPERLPERSADRIPDCRVDAGAGDEAPAPVPQDVERHRSGELPAALDGQGILADQARRDLLVDDPIDLEQVRILVACICLARHALVGVDAGDDGRPMGHPVGAALVGTREWHANRDRLDGADSQAIRHHSPLTAPETSPR